MFDDYSFEFLLEKMIQRVENIAPEIDISEGSLIYNALAPAAWELAEAYISINTILDESFADTASREYLIRRAAERGIKPKLATCAIAKGVFNIDIPLNSRFSLGELNYIAIERIGDGIYKMQCEIEGTSSNKKIGKLIAIEFIENLETAELTEVLIPGEDEEDTEDLRNRYFNSFNSQAFGGNIADYIEKVNNINGVGGVKVAPVWNGGGTVKLSIIDSTFSSPSEELVETVQNIIDPIENNGEGVGLAPIGHIVTVQGVEEITLDISANITYQNGYSFDTIKSNIEMVIDAYLLELRKTWSEEISLTVRISQIEYNLLNINGIIDISGTTINGEISNLVIPSDNIPVRGTINGS